MLQRTECRVPGRKHRRGEREEFVEVAGAGGGAVARVQRDGPAHRAALVAQPVAVTAPGQGRAATEDRLAERGRPAFPLLGVGDVADTESAADVDGARCQAPGPAPVHEQHALLQGPALLLQAVVSK